MANPIAISQTGLVRDRRSGAGIAQKLLSLLLLVIPAVPAYSQTELASERWFQVQSDNFIVISKASSRATERFVDELETWRKIAAWFVADSSPLPKAAVPNYVYLFSDAEMLSEFTYAQDPAFFYPTPRANYMALVLGDEDSHAIARHHYAHFLIKNFADLRLPRWYEEGLAGYLDRMLIDNGEAEFARLSQRNNELMLQISETLSMERLLYRDESLASPRLIQIASLKSASLLHYLLHAYEEEGYPDRRAQLDRYLELLLEGRDARFAYDLAFDVTTEQLDAEFHEYLRTSSRPRGDIDYGAVSSNSDYQTVRIAQDEITLLLGELALNGGSPELAEQFFRASVDGEQAQARSYSGLGDALRFQGLENMDQTIAGYFTQARDMAPEDPYIILDYGEYWEAELTDCDKDYPLVQRQGMLEDIRVHFDRAMALLPEIPETHLALGQLYLFPEEDWRRGVDAHATAFALLPADSFIMEQAVRYAIAADDYERASRLIEEMAQPIHFFGEPEYVTNLRERLLRKRRNEPYDVCAE